MYYLAIQNRSFGVEFSIFFSKDAMGSFDVLKFLMYLSLQLSLLDAIWQGEWYLTNGSGHNQIKINLTTLNNIFSHILQILSYGIFNFCIPRMLEAF